jgi:hypothetical protein
VTHEVGRELALFFGTNQPGRMKRDHSVLLPERVSQFVLIVRTRPAAFLTPVSRTCVWLRVCSGVIGVLEDAVVNFQNGITRNDVIIFIENSPAFLGARGGSRI